MLLIQVRGPLIDGIQFDIRHINANGRVNGHCEFKLPPSLCKDANEIDKPPFPDGPGKNFNEEFLPKISWFQSAVN